MAMPNQTWEMTYSASRRAHHHRCQVCRRIVQDGDRVIMLRRDRGTYVVHVEPCSKAEHSPGSGIDYAEAFRLWGIERNARLGFREARQVVETHPFFRAA